MIAVDTNLLVYAHRGGLPEHRAARAALEEVAAAPSGWGIPQRSPVAAGASEIWTHDRDFVTVPGLRVRDPFARI